MKRVELPDDAVDAQYPVINALRIGDTRPLAVYMKQFERVQGDLLQELLVMLEGTVEETDYQLHARRHPDRGSGKTFDEHFADAVFSQEVAAFVLKRNGPEAGGMEQAIQQAMDHFGLSRSKIWDHVKVGRALLPSTGVKRI